MKSNATLLVRSYAITSMCLGVLWLAIFAFAPTARAQQDGNAGEDLCWQGKNGKTQCVPVTIVRETFADYQTDAAPPTNQLKQVIISANAQYSDALRQFRECQAVLAPLQAAEHQRQLSDQQTQITESNKAAAPAGKEWDPATGKYGPPKLPVPSPTPTPAAKGRGRGR